MHIDKIEGMGQLIALFAACSTDGKTAARPLLAQALLEVYSQPVLPAIARAVGGKPFFPAHPDIHFNYSHSGAYTLCAVGDSPVGVDIEAFRPRSPGLPRAALSPPEFAWFETHGGGWDNFYALWTRKECWVKYTGDGLHSFRHQHPHLPDEPDSPPFLRTFTNSGWIASVCAEEPVPNHIHWLVPPFS